MDDDDDFEYDDDFDYSDGDDEDMRVELELDDLKAALVSEKSQDSAVARLVEIANQSSRFSIDAAFELIQLYPSVESFMRLVHAVHADPSKPSVLMQGWSLMDKCNFDDQLSAAKNAVDLLRDSPLHSRSALLPASVYVRFDMAEQARAVLHDFQTDAIELRAEALVLQIQAMVLGETLNLAEFYSLMDELGSCRLGNVLPGMVALVDEARGRIYVQMEQLEAARLQFRKVVRGYEEMQTGHAQFVRAIVWLILVSTACDEGHYDFNLDLPTLRALRSDQAIANALEVSNSFCNLAASEFAKALDYFKEWKSGWRLGGNTLISILRDRFVDRQMLHALSPYSRMKLDTLKSQITVPLSNERLLRFVSMHNYRLNLIDNTIDTGDGSFEDVVGPPVNSLPKIYKEHEIHQEQARVESKIMNKWQAAPRKKSNQPLASEIQSNIDASKALQEALEKHRDAMLN